MLVLTRRKAQSIIVNDNIEITVIDVLGRKVRLGITAPKSVPVHRKEIYDAIRGIGGGRENSRIAVQPHYTE